MILLLYAPIGILSCFWVIPRVRDERLSIWPWIVGLIVFWPIMMVIAGWRLDEMRFYAFGAIGIIVFVFALLTLSGFSIFSII